jgi:TolB-like protein/Tfp pilus assembly protein PilF
MTTETPGVESAEPAAPTASLQGTVPRAPTPSLPTLLQRLKDHKVAQWTLAYAAAAYTMLHGVEMVSDGLDWPHVIVRIVTLVLFLGAPVAATLAWYHGHRAQHRVSSTELAILTVLLAIAGCVLWFVGRPSQDHAREPVNAVSTVGSPSVAKLSDRSIAVLPFVDLSEKKDQEYFADGMAAQVLDLLAKLPGLRVIGRTSSFQFKAKTDDLRAIGAKLGAGSIVEGSVRKSGDHIRVSAQLVDARDGAQRWSSTYDRKSSDVFEVQDAIAVNLARALELTVSSDFNIGSSVSSVEAYDVYLRGLQALDQGSQDAAERAAGDFQRALDLDPNFAPAALGLAKTSLLQGEDAWVLPTRVPFERARQAAHLALKLDPKIGAAHAVLAEIHMIHDWDWPAADLEIKAALDLGDRVTGLEAAAVLAAVRGEWDQATRLYETALAADPLNANLHLFRAWSVDLRSGRFANAESSMRRALEISPNLGSGRWFLGVALLFQDRLDEALAVMQQETPNDGQLEGSAIVYYAMGKKAESDAAMKLATEHDAQEWPSAIARVHAFRGERDEALKWLERAYSVRDEDLYLIKGDPLMKSLEGDPRYETFLRKMNLPQ